MTGRTEAPKQPRSLKQLMHDISPAGRREKRQNEAWNDAQNGLQTGMAPFEDRIRGLGENQPLSLLVNAHEQVYHKTAGSGSTDFYRTLGITPCAEGQIRIDADVTECVYNAYPHTGINDRGNQYQWMSYNHYANRSAFSVILDPDGRVVEVACGTQKKEGGDNPIRPETVEKPELKAVAGIEEKTSAVREITHIFEKATEAAEK